jgi:hypothetical protein
MIEMRWLEYEEYCGVGVAKLSKKLQWRTKTVFTTYEEWSEWLDVPTVKEAK